MKILLLLSILVLTACSSTADISSNSKATDIVQLIEKAKRRFPEGVIGTFQIPIKASGSQSGITFLNSDLDYRNPKNITLALAPSIIESFTKQYGSSPASYFVNKTLEVRGKVERIRIYQFEDGKRSRKYYYQTHIRITAIDQIKVLS